MGVIVWEMIMGCTPIDDMEDVDVMMFVIKEEFDFESLRCKIDNKYLCILHGMLDKDPKIRWDAN